MTSLSLSNTIAYGAALFIFLILPTNCLVQFPAALRGRGIQKSGERESTVLHIDLTTLVGAAVGGGALVLWISGAEDRAQQEKYKEWEAKDQAIREERAKLAFIEPKEFWTESELAQYNGSDETGPLLFAAGGEVFNVWKGRHFYGPGCEYHIFAGRDASRLLAKSKLEEETEEEKEVPLSIAEKAALQGWIYTFKSKYEIVGKLRNFDPKTIAF